jgi:tetratricopeptide (TPR) repeat protein
LDTTARSVLEAAAVGTGQVDAGEVAAVTGMSEDDVLSALRALVDAGLLVVDQRTEAATFRHELLREAAEAALLPQQRRRLHRRHAELSDARAAGGDGQAALAAAHHWGAAGDITAAWRAAEVAIEAAAGAGLRRQEWRLLAQQLERHDQAAAAGVTVPDRVSLLQRAGAAAARCGEFDQGAQLLEKAWRSLDPRTDPARLLDVLDDLVDAVHGGVLHRGWDGNIAVAALAALPTTPSPARLRGLRVLFSFQAERRDFDAAWATIREAVACAEELGDMRQAAKLRLSAVVMLGIDNDDPPRALQYFAEARAVARAADDHGLVLWTAMNEADFLYNLGRHEEGLARAREALALAEQLPAVAEMHEYVIGNLAEALFATGHWAEGLDRLLTHTELDRPDIMRGVIYLVLAMFQLEIGDRDAADVAYAEGCARVAAGLDPQIPVHIGLVGAELALAHERPSEAVRLAREAFLAHAHHVPTLRSCQLLHSAARAAAHLDNADPAQTQWMRAGLDRLRNRPLVPAPFWPALLAAEVAGSDIVLWEAALAAIRQNETPCSSDCRPRSEPRALRQWPASGTGPARCSAKPSMRRAGSAPAGCISRRRRWSGGTDCPFPT